jgi:hypothetical protein
MNYLSVRTISFFGKQETVGTLQKRILCAVNNGYKHPKNTNKRVYRISRREKRGVKTKTRENTAIPSRKRG